MIHPELSKPQLMEVSLELGFISESEASSNILLISEGLRSTFPILEQSMRSKDGRKLTKTDIPLTSVAEENATFSFLTESRRSIIVVSDDSVFFGDRRTYTGWMNFLEECETIIHKLHEILNVLSYNRANLKFVNVVSLSDRKAKNILNDWLISKPPKTIETIGELAERRVIILPFAEGVQYITVVNPVRNSKNELGIKIEIEHRFTGGNDTHSEWAAVKDWLEIAHDRIYESFTASLREDFMKEIS